MGVAAQLLEQSSLQVSEIAVRVGYQSEFSFSRAFRKARGLSPMQAWKRAVTGAPADRRGQWRCRKRVTWGTALTRTWSARRRRWLGWGSPRSRRRPRDDRRSRKGLNHFLDDSCALAGEGRFSVNYARHL